MENKIETKPYTFIELFGSYFDVKVYGEHEKNKLEKIIIPMIQRDYAQGRNSSSEVSRIRKGFLNALYESIIGEPIKLDFIYGDLGSSGVFTPLDGQQRLTTLFLLHWYAAKKENIDENKWRFLYNFSYQTRFSAREFCRELVGFNPDFSSNDSISEQIMDQNWFPFGWLKDPTVSSMLVMLDEIDEKFKDLTNIWENLANGKISFYVLLMSKMGLTDALYIKMNSRGKLLTDFENLKSEFERQLKLCDKSNATKYADSIIESIDRNWTDLLWNCCSKENEDSIKNAVDDSFLRYYRFISDILLYRNDINVALKSRDDFEILEELYSVGNDSVCDNLDFFISCFECWDKIKTRTGKDRVEFFDSIFSKTHENNKIVFPSDNTDLFKECLESYGKRNGKRRVFPLNKALILYSIIVYLNNTITESDFIVRLRIINNLINNSSDELAERTDRNNISGMIKQIESIIKDGKILDLQGYSFNTNQLKEEILKQKYLLLNPNDTETLYKLEDHDYLYGQIGIVGLDNLTLADRFIELFGCDKDKVDCALMSIGFYCQLDINGTRFQFGTGGYKSAWDNLFHLNKYSGFARTKDCLINLLNKSTSFDNSVLDNIINSYIDDCENNSIYPFNYYYIKYPEFRPQRYGKYINRLVINNDFDKSYVYSALYQNTTESSNSYIPYLSVVDKNHISRDDYGRILLYDDVKVSCDNDGFSIVDNKTESIIERVEVKKNSDGYDTENRIDKLRNALINQGLIKQ